MEGFTHLINRAFDISSDVMNIIKSFKNELLKQGQYILDLEGEIKIRDEKIKTLSDELDKLKNIG